MKRNLIALLFLTFVAAALAARIESFDENWEYALTDFEMNFEKVGIILKPADNSNDNGTPHVACNTSSDWKAVTLPHDWAASLPNVFEKGSRYGFKALGPDYPQNNIAW